PQQKDRAGAVPRRYANGKNYPVAIAESLDSVLVDSRRRRIRNRDGRGIRGAFGGKYRRDAGAARHAPIGEGAGIETDFDPSAVKALQRTGPSGNQPQRRFLSGCPRARVRITV